MKYGSSLLYSPKPQWDFVCCRKQEAANYTQLVKSKNVDSPDVLKVSQYVRHEEFQLFQRG